MTKSRKAEVNITQATLTGQNAQNTADKVAKGVTDLNDPNLMSVIEKQTQAAQYAGLTSQYNVILARAKDASISTTALTTAYTNLNTFMTAILTDTTKASDVNRDTYKSLTDAYNTALSNVQTALKDAYNTDISNMQSSVSVASQAASSAAIVASQATTTGNNASQVASQAASAANQASADYTALSSGVKDGSVVHITTKTAIDSAVIGTAEIVDAAITDAKVGTLSANHLTAGTIDFNTITGKNINASNITTGTLSTDRLNVGKLSALSANLGDVTTGSLKGVDIVANSFSTPNGSFTTDSNGAITAKNMTLIGGKLTSPTINASTINGSTINGATFNAGGVISNSNNTAGYYPMTITSDGAYKSTYFDSNAGLQSSVESGGISYKYRSMTSSGGTYSYDNVVVNGQGITLDGGTTTNKDTNFSVAETETAYISLTTEAGLYLHGSNAQIDFGGHLSDDSASVGMYMNPYGNLIAKSASHYWQISVAGTDNAGGGPVARFGIDNASAYNIVFNRELDIGNLQINTGHTITSADNGAIHFAMGKGGATGIYAGAVNYTSLVKSSLLSVKKDVKKADTAYWAQLVNSIDLATYQYKSDDNTSHIRLSSIVDDVNDTKQWRLPDVFISRDEDGKLNGVDDSVLLNATLATVQEQQKQIDQLNGHNMELEARLNKLEAKLNG